MLPFDAADTERAAAMAPWFKKFGPWLDHECRRIGEAGSVLKFFPALEEVKLGGCDLRDLSFVEALPNLRSLQLSSAVLEDLRPLMKCAALRHLSLGFTGSQYPCLAPPLYWVDAEPLGALQALESLTLYPNAAVLSGLRFPSLKSAELSGGNCVQRDCGYLPEMPALRRLKLEGPQSLRGIGRFPELRHLTVSGPLRDFGDIAELRHLSCLEVDTLDGWPTDVAPLTKLPELLWVSFSNDIPRNYWPLTKAPRLCEAEVPKPLLHESPVALDVQAINAVLRPWDEVFHLPEPRAYGRLRFVMVETGGDTRALPERLQEPEPEWLEHPKLFHLELLWMSRRAQEVLARFDGDVDHARFRQPGESSFTRGISIQIHTLAAAERLPELLDALRGAMAASPHEWRFGIYLNLRITKREMTEQEKKWLEQIEEISRSREDESDHERWSRTQQHLIETRFRLRTDQEEGETSHPEDFEPPDDIRPESWREAKPVPAGPAAGGNDSGEEDDPDFALKPFDEQVRDSANDDGGDDSGGNVKTAPPPEPPEDFWEDPYAHPLADSYRFWATLTFDTFYCEGYNLATVRQLMGRGPDEYYPAPEQQP
ncbi:MAG: hypothetical protein V4726_04475 [Verrucomicrobiota bacterium]